MSAVAIAGPGSFQNPQPAAAAHCSPAQWHFSPAQSPRLLTCSFLTSHLSLFTSHFSIQNSQSATSHFSLLTSRLSLQCDFSFLNCSPAHWNYHLLDHLLMAAANFSLLTPGPPSSLLICSRVPAQLITCSCTSHYLTTSQSDSVSLSESLSTFLYRSLSLSLSLSLWLSLHTRPRIYIAWPLRSYANC